MLMKKRFSAIFTAISAAIILMMTLAACNTGKNLASGSTWEVTETTSLKTLTIADGASIKAPEGKSLTMTVEGVETGIIPGAYKGRIILTPTENIAKDNYNFRTAVYIENGKYIAGKSVAAAVAAGTVTDTSATGVKITSAGEKFNGIMVTGDAKSSYSINNPVISLTGNGANDFVGYGAAIMTDGKAEVTIDNARIINTGAVRTAVFVGGDSITKVNNSYIEVHDGTLPADYEFSVQPGKMMAVPWMLGITGNLRATNLAGNGTVYYENTHIKAQGWGCLSSDNVGTSPRLYATNCVIETIDSGYGAFSLGTNIATFSKCTFNVKDYGMISQEGDGVFTDGTMVNSDRYGVMFFGTGNLTIDKKSVFNTKKTSIQVKGCGSNIVVDDATLNPGNGIILQTMANDDPYMSGRGGGPPVGGAPGAGGAGGGPPADGGMPGGAGGPGGAPAGGAPGGGSPGGAPGGGAPPPGGGTPGGNVGGPGGAGGGAASSNDVKATFSNITLTGDIINANTASGALAVIFKNANITGAISTATVEHALGPNGEEVTMEHPELYNLIGDVKNTFCATKDKYGLEVSLEEGSTWVVDETSYLTGLTAAEGATIKAPEGYSVTMTVNGAAKAIKAGTYKGKIVLTVW